MRNFIIFMMILFCMGITSGQQPGTINWTYHSQGRICSSPAITAGRDLLFGADDGSGHMELIALTDDGDLIWKKVLPGRYISDPFIAKNGHIYVVTTEDMPNYVHTRNRLIAMDDKGTELWRYEFVSDGSTHPVEGGDCSIYLGLIKGNGIGELRSFTPEGDLRWSVDLSGHPSAQPIVLQDGSICMIAYNMRSVLYIFNPDGSVRLKKNVNDVRSLACDESGILYLACKPFIAMDLSGNSIWSYDSGWASFLYTVLDSAGNVYTINSEADVYSLDKQGNLRWSYTIAGMDREWIIAGDKGMIYCGNSQKIVGLSKDGNPAWEYAFSSQILSNPRMDDQGVLYVACEDGSIYALSTPSEGLAESPWPMFRRDACNSGSAYDPDAPVACIGSSDYYCALPGNMVTLDGSTSLSDGDPLEYHWILKRKPLNSQYSIEDPGSAAQTVMLDSEDRGRFIFGLWVSNADGCSYAETCLDCGVFWRRKLEGHVLDKMAVDQENQIYLTTDDSTLLALDQDGNMEWSKKLDNLPDVPVAGSDGRIYLLKGRQDIIVLSGNGQIQNTYRGHDFIPFSPAIGKGGQVIFYEGNQVVALTNELSEAWRWTLNGNGSGKPAIAQDGTIYASGSNGMIHVLSPEGHLKAMIPGQANVYTSPAISQNGTLFFCDTNNEMHVFSIEGRKIWDGISTVFNNSPVLDLNDNVYVRQPLQFSAISCSGDVLWNFSLGDVYPPLTMPPVAGSDGMVYLTTSDSLLLALDPQGTVLWDYPLYSYAPPSMDYSGRLLLADCDGYLYAIETSEPTQPKSFWRMDRCNPSNTLSLYNENAPEARIAEGDTLIILPGEAFTLTGSESSDPDGDALKYDWSLIDRPDSSDFVFGGSSLPDLNLVFNWDQTGRYNFSLTVRDDEDGISQKQIVVWCGLKWYRKIGTIGYRETAPAIGLNGEIIFNSGETIYSYNSNGTYQWQYQTGEDPVGPPAVMSTGQIVFGGSKGNLWFFSEAGLLEKQFSLGSASYRNLCVIGPQSTLFFTAGEKIHAVNSDKALWHRSYPDEEIQAMGPDGTLYMVGKSILALDSDGNMKWDFNSNSDYTEFYTLAVDEDGRVYAACSDNRLYAVTPEGREKWHVQFTGLSVTNPVISSSGIIYLCGRDAQGSGYSLYALDRNGEIEWEFGICSEIKGSPLIGADQTVYFCSDSSVYAISEQGLFKWRFQTDGMITCSPVMDKAGVLYYLSSDKKFYALQTRSGKLDDGPWPKFQKDIRCSGSAFNPDIPVALIAEGDTLYCPPDTLLMLHAQFLGEQISCSWSVLEKPQGSGIQFIDSTSSECMISFNPMEYGIYRLILTVTDGALVSTDGIVIMHGIKWSRKGENELYFGSPAFGLDKTCYVRYDYRGLAVDSIGGLLWRVGATGQTSMAVDSDRVYVVKANFLRQYNPEGFLEREWKYESNISTELALQQNGILYFGTEDKYLHAIDRFGRERWKKRIAKPVQNIVLDHRGRILFKSDDGYLNCHDWEGSRLWRFQTRTLSGVSAAYGRIYTSGYLDGVFYLYCIGENGEEYWKYGMTYEIAYSVQPVVDEDTTVYVGTLDNLFAVDSRGQEKWRFPTPYASPYTPVIGADGTVYFSTPYNTYAVTPQGKLLWHFPVGTLGIFSLAMDPDGILIMGSYDLYAFYTQSQGLQNCPWSKFQHDYRNSAAVPVDSVIALFSADTARGNAPFTVRFIDESLGPVEKWTWEFGTGETGTEQNPVYTYSVPGAYTVKLKAEGSADQDQCIMSSYIRVSSGSSVEENGFPNRFALHEAYPNPFNQATAISYQLPRRCRVRISVHNLRGEEIAVLAEGMKEAGENHLKWNANNSPSDIYIIKMTASNFVQMRKVVLLK